MVRATPSVTTRAMCRRRRSQSPVAQAGPVRSSPRRPRARWSQQAARCEKGEMKRTWHGSEPAAAWHGHIKIEVGEKKKKKKGATQSCDGTAGAWYASTHRSSRLEMAPRVSSRKLSLSLVTVHRREGRGAAGMGVVQGRDERGGAGRLGGASHHRATRHRRDASTIQQHTCTLLPRHHGLDGLLSAFGLGRGGCHATAAVATWPTARVVRQPTFCSRSCTFDRSISLSSFRCSSRGNVLLV